MPPCRFFTNRETKRVEAGFGNTEHTVVVLDALGQSLQVVLDTGNGVGQGVQLLPVRNLFATEKNIGDIALGRREHIGHTVQRNQAKAAADAMEQAGYMLDFAGFPLGGNKVDDSRLDLLKGIA